MNSSFELLEALKKLDLLKDTPDLYWWPNSGSFEVVIGAILTQQTKWQKVERSLENLRTHDFLELEKLTQIDTLTLSQLIKPSGFYNTKAKRLKALCVAIVQSFDNFDNFKDEVSREWLLEQKGVGEESADAILCYACEREVMVVDNYTNKLLNSFGYEFETYQELQEWITQGIEANLERCYQLYGREIDLRTIYSRFHGKIVEFSKNKRDVKEIFL